MKSFFYRYKFHTMQEIINDFEKIPQECLRLETYAEEDSLKPAAEFEDSLAQKHIGYFAYIKFFISGDEKYGIVAGKSGSRLVNQAAGSDVSFSMNRVDGESRRFLLQKRLSWYKKEVLVFPADNEKEAYQTEADLKEMYGLLGK